MLTLSYSFLTRNVKCSRCLHTVWRTIFLRFCQMWAIKGWNATVLRLHRDHSLVNLKFQYIHQDVRGLFILHDSVWIKNSQYLGFILAGMMKETVKCLIKWGFNYVWWTSLEQIHIKLSLRILSSSRSSSDRRTLLFQPCLSDICLWTSMYFVH